LTVFADSSAIVKLYADEPDADLVRAVPVFVVAALARVEVPAALWRKTRMGQLPAEDAAVLNEVFEHDWYDARGRFLPIVIAPAILDDAARLARVHELRAYDALQLSCARATREVDGQVGVFLCFDSELREAAVREGFALA
jgi:predicted nucleic acid-binding protein